MERRKMVGVYALIALGLVLAMGFAPMERGMAADSAEPSTNVMDDLPIEIYVMDDLPIEIYVMDDLPIEIYVMDDLPIEIYGDVGVITISGLDLGDFDGIIAIMLHNLVIDSLPENLVILLIDEDVEAGMTVPLLVIGGEIDSSGATLYFLGLDEITIDSTDNIAPLVMDDLPIEIYVMDDLPIEIY